MDNNPLSLLKKAVDTHDLEIVADNLDVFLMTDQPETCRKCGVRTEWISYKDDSQLHTCPSCDYIYLVEECDE
jgi:hypothetical protein